MLFTYFSLFVKDTLPEDFPVPQAETVSEPLLCIPNLCMFPSELLLLFVSTTMLSSQGLDHGGRKSKVKWMKILSFTVAVPTTAMPLVLLGRNWMPQNPGTYNVTLWKMDSAGSLTKHFSWSRRLMQSQVSFKWPHSSGCEAQWLPSIREDLSSIPTATK